MPYDLTGSYDLHIHTAPDVFARKLGDLEMARQAADAGMGGFTVKSHVFPTPGRAALLRELYPQLDALGAVAEFSYCHVLSGKCAPAYIAGQIKAIGAEHAILSTDLGQKNNPYPVEGLISGLVGLLMGCVGMDSFVGHARYTFHIAYLQTGIQLIVALIGLFSISQVLTLASSDNTAIVDKEMIRNLKPAKFTVKDICRYPITYLRSGIIGTIVGIIPGAGGSIAAFLGYNEAKRASKHPELFGTGIREGVGASESANNAVSGGALIPMLTLGIPGSTACAVMLGGMMVHGLLPGNDLFTVQANVKSREGSFKTKGPADFLGNEVGGKVFGQIGMGNIAQRIAYIMGAGFRCKVLGCDPFVSAEEAAKRGFEKVDTVEELLERSDLVNVNVPLVKSTQNLVSREAMAHFKPGAVFVNAARGGVIDEDALYDALAEGRLRAAACDTFTEEPVNPNHKLLTLRNFSATPHLGGNTEEALQKTGMQVVRDTLAVLNGDWSTAHRVN